MSGDVQPRKRKDKKKKKDDLGVEEPRGTAAAFGEGDVFMHSQSEHGTGGHWCAKVIFFSLLAVLITLIGLIILENRGLTELEANSVETKYSGVLEGWIEDAPDDDHHDEHTLELKHHDEDDADHGSELEHDDDDHNDDDHDDDDDDENDDHENDDENDDEDENDSDSQETDLNADASDEADNAQNDDDDDDDDEEENDASEERDINTAEEEDDIEEPSYRKFYESDKANIDDGDDDDDVQKESDEQNENDQDDDNDDDDEQPLDDDDNDEKENESDEDKRLENNDDDDNGDDYLQNDAAQEDEEEHEEEEPVNIEIETIEKEIPDDDVVSAEEPANDDENQSQDVSEELSPNEDESSVEDDDVEFLEPDELDELPIVEPITAPKGKPLPEVEESPSTPKPQDTLADEEEYERQQEELRKEREQASQGMWLKLTVGGALLVATHAVLRRATASRETDTAEDEADFREETPLSDRRMTLISEPVAPPTVASPPEVYQPIEREVVKNIQSFTPGKEEIEEEEEEEIIISKPADTIDKELYSDEEEIEEEEEIIEPTKVIPQQAVPQAPQTIQTVPPQSIPDVTKEVTPEPDEDDDVEIIDEEQLEEELEEEEEISDVDDAELLSRLEEKYGRLPEPDRRTNKDGGNSIEDEWPNEPADAFWSEQLDQAQHDLRQDWLD